VLVGLDAADEEGIALTQSLHQTIKRLLELRTKSRRLLACLRTHVELIREDLHQELVLAGGNDLQQIGAESIAVLLQEAFASVHDRAGKVHHTELGIKLRLGLDVVGVLAVAAMKLGQHSIIRAIGEASLLIDKRNDVHWLIRNHIECLLVVFERDLGPANVFFVILVLLHLEDVTNEELLKVFVGVVDAKLLKAANVSPQKLYVRKIILLIDNKFLLPPNSLSRLTC
jgi:hypothetical protein